MSGGVLTAEKVGFGRFVRAIRRYPAGSPSSHPQAVARAAGACPEGKDAPPEVEKDENGRGTTKGGN